jgi:titin
MIRPDARRPAIRRLAVVASLVALALNGLSAVPASAALPTWSTMTSPNLGTNANHILGVSCPTDTTCVAVGFALNAGGVRRVLTEVRQGATWSVVTAPNLSTTANSLAAVSCPSATNCVAVGSAFNGSKLVTLIEAWDGTSWSIMPSPTPGTVGGELVGVSCASVASCVAVGDYIDATGVVRTLVLTWSGSSWTAALAPSPGPSTALLNGVSCASSTSCVAVGYSVNYTGTVFTLVETMTGTTWSVMPSPSPSPGALLNGVSCVSPTSCVAVGWTGDVIRRALIEVLHGATWSVVASPSPSAAYGYLRGVSCTTAARCSAVGYSVNGGVTRTLVEAWSGATWSISASPNPGTIDSSLMAVSCASATSCVAGGHRLSSMIATTLVVSGTAAADVTPPAVSLSTPVPNGYYVLGQSAAANYKCIDEVGGSGIVSCAGTVAAGAPIDTSAVGVQPFSVTGTDGSGNSTPLSASYTVVGPASASAQLPPGGGSITTDAGGGPTALAPVATTLTSPNQGSAEIDQGAVTLVPPSGFRLLGVQVDVVAPPASAGAPLTLVLDVDAAMLPPGTTKDNLALLHDAALVPECPNATTVPGALDACVSGRTAAPSGGGDVRLTVLSESGVQWNLGAGAATLPTVSMAGNSMAEGNSGTTPMTFTVSLSAPSALPVTVHYQSVDGSAHAGTDYVAASGNLTFSPGEVQHTVTVMITGDKLVESNESFVVALSAPAGATIGTAVGTGMILDDDAVVPGPPSALAVTPGNASAVLYWKAPAVNGGRAIGGYIVTPRIHGVAQTARVFTNIATSETISGLTNGTAYTFDVAATNAVGVGARSAASPSLVVGAPFAPTVSAVSSSTRAVVSWNPPATNGFIVTSYAVFVYRDSVLQTGHVATCTQPCTPARTWTFNGLVNGAQYTFKVEARNSQGAGPQGSTRILVSATPTVPGKPGTPSAKAGVGTVTVSWGAPAAGTASISDYLIVGYKNGVASPPFVAPPYLTTHPFLTVTAGASFTFTIQARNAVGVGPISALSQPVKPT